MDRRLGFFNGSHPIARLAVTEEIPQSSGG